MPEPGPTRPPRSQPTADQVLIALKTTSYTAGGWTPQSHTLDTQAGPLNSTLADLISHRFCGPQRRAIRLRLRREIQALGRLDPQTPLAIERYLPHPEGDQQIELRIVPVTDEDRATAATLVAAIEDPVAATECLWQLIHSTLLPSWSRENGGRQIQTCWLEEPTAPDPAADDTPLVAQCPPELDLDTSPPPSAARDTEQHPAAA